MRLSAAGMVLGFLGAWVVLVCGQLDAWSTPPADVPVLVTALVQTKAGGVVRGLAAQDFSALVDGTKSEVVQATQEARPVSAIAMIDRSASMPYSRDFGVSPLGEGLVRGALKSLQPTDDFAMGRISTETVIGETVKHDQWSLERAAMRLADGVRASSPLWDGVNQAITVLKTRPGRRLIILITDGRSNGNVLSVTKVAQNAVEAGVIVSTIDQNLAEIYVQADGTSVTVRPDRALRWLAAATGGLYLADAPSMDRPANADVLSNLVARSLESVRHAYVLAIMVPDDSKPHSIEITATEPAYSVTSPASVLVKR